MTNEEFRDHLVNSYNKGQISGFNIACSQLSNAIEELRLKFNEIINEEINDKTWNIK